MAFEEDFSAYLDPSEFGDVCVFHLAEGEDREAADVTCNGILDNPGVEAKGGAARAETSNPEIWCKTLDVASVLRGDTVTVRGLTFDVVRKEPDGTGMSTVILAPQQDE